MTIPYSPEHSTTRQNDAILKKIAEIGGKPLLTAPDPVFTHDLEATGDIQPLWPFFLGAALILFFCDVAVRRVFFELPQLQRFLARIGNWLVYPFRRRVAPIGPATEEIGKLMQAKARVSDVEPARAEPKDDFLRRLEAVKEEELAKIDEPSAKPDLAWVEAKKDEEPQKFADEEKDAYTSALFRAKQRAKENIDERRK